jgi:hypothetical protein
VDPAAALDKPVAMDVEPAAAPAEPVAMDVGSAAPAEPVAIDVGPAAAPAEPVAIDVGPVRCVSFLCVRASCCTVQVAAAPPAAGLPVVAGLSASSPKGTRSGAANKAKKTRKEAPSPAEQRQVKRRKTSHAAADAFSPQVGAKRIDGCFACTDSLPVPPIK